MQQGDYTSSSSYYNAGNNAQYPPVPPPNPPAPIQFPLNPPYPSDPIPPLQQQQHQHQQPIPIPTSLSYASAPPYSIPSSDYGNSPSPYPPQSFSHNPDHVPTAPSYAPPVQQQPPPSSFQSFESHSPYQQYDAVPSYTPTPAPAPAPPPAPAPTSSFNQNPSIHSSTSAQYPSQYGNLGLSYESPFDQRSYLDENLAKYGGGGYNSHFNAPNTSINSSGFSRSRSDLSSGGGDYYMDDGVYQYSGSNNKVEPYGARGTGSKSSMWSSGGGSGSGSGGGGGGGGGALFDDYGRAISSSGGSSSFSKGGGGGGAKIVKAVPKVEVDQDAKSGVQKFRVKLLAESGGQSTMDVLCQVSEETNCMLSSDLLFSSSGVSVRVCLQLVMLAKRYGLGCRSLLKNV